MRAARMSRIVFESLLNICAILFSHTTFIYSTLQLVLIMLIFVTKVRSREIL